MTDHRNLNGIEIHQESPKKWKERKITLVHMRSLYFIVAIQVDDDVELSAEREHVRQNHELLRLFHASVGQTYDDRIQSDIVFPEVPV